MTHAPTPAAPQPDAADAIPTLSHDMAWVNVPQAVSLALDARAAEKAALMALSEELVQNLRPEIERMTSDMVQRTLQSEWAQRSRLYQEE